MEKVIDKSGLLYLIQLIRLNFYTNNEIEGILDTLLEDNI